MSFDPLATINDIFREHGKALRPVCIDLNVEHINDQQLSMIAKQLNDSLGPYRVITNPGYLHLVAKSHRATPCDD